MPYISAAGNSPTPKKNCHGYQTSSKEFPTGCITLFGMIGPDDWRDHAIEVPDCRGKKVSMAMQKSVREQTAGSVEELVGDMLKLRARNKHNKSALRRLLKR